MNRKIVLVSILIVSSVNFIYSQDIIYPEDVMISVEKTKYVKLRPEDTVYTAQKEIVGINKIHSVTFLKDDSLKIEYETGRKVSKTGSLYDILFKKDKSTPEMETVSKIYGMNKIRGARITTGSSAALGAGIGLIAGVGLGYLFGSYIRNTSHMSKSAGDNVVIVSAVLCGGTGLAVGWLIGGINKTYDYLTFSDADKDKKNKLMQFIRRSE
jgi:hypothetical protein